MYTIEFYLGDQVLRTLQSPGLPGAGSVVYDEANTVSYKVVGVACKLPLDPAATEVMWKLSLGTTGEE